MDIQKRVVEIVSKYLGVPQDEIDLDSHLQDDLNSDPLSKADLVISLEDEFKIKIPPEELQRFEKVGDIVDYIAEELGEV
ncbi:MAG TPA: acyl carrier protein [Candidatus Saccharimonadales bacterium]|nr:acyl carrier protein [Candidatus Saccharimonadales bacterium]